MKKSSFLKSIGFLAVGAALAAGGYYLGRHSIQSTGVTSLKKPASTPGFAGGKIATAKLNADNASLLDDFLKGKGKPDAAELAAWVRGLSPEECAAALATLQGKPAGMPRDAIMDAIMKSWAGRDPQGFLSSSDSMTSPRLREQGVDAALKALAAKDPQAALQWLKDNAGSGSPANQQARYSAMISGYAASDPAGAFTLVSGMAEDTPANQRQKNQALQAFVSGLGDEGRFSEALTYVNQLADGQSKNQALASLAQNWAQSAPADASAWIASLTDPAMRNNLSSQLVATWAGSDPAAAAAWAAQMDLQNANAAQDPNNPGPNNQNLLAGVMNNWASYDLDAAGKYLNSLPASSGKDGATASFALNAAAQDPAGAMNWVNTVTDDSMRERLALVTALEWENVDSNGASQFIANTTLLSDDEKNLLANVPPFVSDMLTGGGPGGGPGGGGPGGFGGGPGGGGRGGPGGGGQPQAGGATATSGISQQVLNFVISGSGADILTGGGPGGRGGRGGRGGGGGGG